MPELKVEPKPIDADEKMGINLIGEEKSGKTCCFMSLSPHFDPTWSKIQDIPDLAHVTCDMDALRGPRLMGVRSVKYRFDMSDYLDGGIKVVEQALESIIAQIMDLAKRKEIVGVGWDTMTMLDETWKSYMLKQGYEKWGLSDQVNAKHRDFIVKVLKIPVPQIFMLHTKEISSTMTEAQMADHGIKKGTKYVMALSAWDGPKLYRTQCSYTVPIKRIMSPGKPDEFFLYPRGVDGIEASGRYGRGGAPDKLPANLRQFLDVVNGKQQAA